MYELVLPFREPFDWTRLLRFFEIRAIPGVESVESDRYERVVRIGDHVGTVSVGRKPSANALEAAISLPSSTRNAVTRRLTTMFDLDADVVAIRRVLEQSPVTRSLIEANPGVRIPRAWDPFEIVIRAIVGQQVSVAAGRTILGRIVDRANGGGGAPFPEASVLAGLDVRGFGMPDRRAHTVREAARAVAEGRVDLENAHAARRELLALSGIGPWTVEYVAMRALGDRDAFPHGDLILRRVASEGGPLLSTRELQEMAEAWRPWRAYAAILLWGAATK